MKMPGASDPEYVRSRKALLDALEALGSHSSAVILAGAQAIYLHTGEGDLAVAPYTTDGDLAFDPSALADEPKIEVAMRSAGFVRSPDNSQIGTWISPDGVPIDLFVPDAVGGTGRRAAKLASHGDRVARKARGLEAILVDKKTMSINTTVPFSSTERHVVVCGRHGLLPGGVVSSVTSAAHRAVECRARLAGGYVEIRGG